ncbi:PilX N-terminal domain-containing pilus assembly protein [Lysobacter sp. LF1]|uniref:PilX N-terminal domain-containing pilus assembly protein n=1 Tax=Lysobacter stagni TaxID=3045172 RepID=A0ABT6XKV7_9GAMM|nr:PilX N-terminal domain-containing pilus assembly protein [Lysobacter sp. LF1]MDI9240787.1 PilX N-terminal domain-containing pilus assembly protein [Lysobacter sp. LF1]
MRNIQPPRPAQQRGAALVVVLLLLLIVTLLGLASMRGTILQERMAANTVTRAMAFQAAEAGLREAEGVASGKPGLPSSGCSNGACARAASGQAAAWEADDFWDTAGGWRLAAAATNDIRPQFVVEDFGRGVSSSCTNNLDMSADECTSQMQVYRITVHSRASNGAEVLLQSLYEVQ